jgi:pimeloyl-ACP methyl ester carboxylesterase
VGSAFVLVHGAWHGGWCWRRVVERLRSAGRTVHAPTLTGLGERSHLFGPSVTLASHVQDVVAVLEFEDLRDVVLVGHSYGGTVITGVADRAPERLAHLVYLDALVPEDGQSWRDTIWPASRAARDEQIERHGALAPATLEYFGVAEPADRAWVEPRLTPQPPGTWDDPLRLTNPDAARLPRTYIWCTETPSRAFHAYAAAARAPDSGWRYHELATGHDAMITRPEEVVRILLEASASAR